MANAILSAGSRKIPLSVYFESLGGDSKTFNKTIFSSFDDNELLSKVVGAVQEIMKDVPKDGFMFSIPIENVFCNGNLSD